MKNTAAAILMVILWSGPAWGEEPAAKPAPLFDLTQVQGLDQYNGPYAGRALLAERGLFISPETKPQLFQCYTHNNLPPFVTTDTGLHAYGVILEKAFRKLEYTEAATLAEFQDRLWRLVAEGSDHGEPVFANGATWPAALQTPVATMVAVGEKLLHPEWKPETEAGRKLYEKIAGDVEAELKRIAGGRVEESPLFGAKVDYAGFRPRGFYAGDPKLSPYFKARMFWATPMNLDDDRVLQTAAVLGTLCLGRDQDDQDYLARLIDPLESLIGPANLPAVANVAGMLYLGDPHAEVEACLRLAEPAAAAEARKTLRDQLPKPLVPFGADLQQVMDNTTKPAKDRPLWAALWPQVAMPDSAMMFRCVWPHVPEFRRPGGLDVMACCGNDRALALLLAAEPEANRKPLETIIKDTRDKRHRLLARDEGRGPDREDHVWKTPLNEDDKYARPEFDQLRTAQIWGGLDLVFETLREPGLTKSHPRFMTTTAYADKSLNTALGAWAVYRHTFVLHAQCGGYALCCWDSPPGYVEPNLPFWKALRDVAIQDCLWLHAQGVDATPLADLAKFCITAESIAEKQLAGRELSPSDKDWLNDFDQKLGHLCGYDTNMLDTVEEECGLVADIGGDRAGQNVLYVATARPRNLYVIMDYGGKLQLARGGVTSYREFLRPAAEARMTDDEWQKLLKAQRDPPVPAWLAALGTEYTAESVLADVKAGRAVGGKILDRFATKEIMMVLMDQAAALAEKEKDTDQSEGPLFRLIDDHPEWLDRDFAKRYLALAEAHNWKVYNLPPKAEWLDLYMEAADFWARAKGSKNERWYAEWLGSQAATAIARIDSPKALDWFQAAQAAKPSHQYVLPESDVLTYRDELPDGVLAIVTDRVLADLEVPPQAKPAAATGPEHQATDAADNPVPAEKSPLALEEEEEEELRFLAIMWPHWTPTCFSAFRTDFHEELPEHDKPCRYTPAQIAIRDRAIAGVKKLAQRHEGQRDYWSEADLRFFVLCLGPETLKTPLADQLKKYPAALKYALPAEGAAR